MKAPPLSVDDTFDLDPRVEPFQFDEYAVLAAMQAAETRRVLAALKQETPRLPTLTIISVLHDIVEAIRERWQHE